MLWKAGVGPNGEKKGHLEGLSKLVNYHMRNSFFIDDKVLNGSNFGDNNISDVAITVTTPLLAS